MGNKFPNYNYYMITIISGTDRKDGLTHVLASHYYQVIQSKTTETVRFYSLEDLPPDLYGPMMYKKDTMSEAFQEIEDTLLIPADKFFFVIPEYNGSFPGILKLFVDAASIRSRMAIFKGKKAGLTGIATGRAGNIRGLEHFASVMMFMGVTVFPNLLPLSGFNKLLDGEKENIVDEGTLKAIEQQVEAFLAF
jgi:chromate reductase, NAD(P)H dehydrogenase (quinone)